MAFFGSEGIARPFAVGTARGGSRVATSTVAGGGYGSGGITTESKAPYSAGGATVSARAGDGQRFPFNAREVGVVEGVVLAEDEGALLLE